MCGEDRVAVKLLTQSTKRFITALGGSGFVVEAA
jgi:hypothetical protein